MQKAMLSTFLTGNIYCLMFIVLIDKFEVYMMTTDLKYKGILLKFSHLEYGFYSMQPFPSTPQVALLINNN